MGFGIDRRARPRKGRGLFRRAPDPREVAERLDRLARRMFKGTVRAPSRKRAPRSIELDLHASAPAVIVAVTDDGELAVTGDTARLGPGYHVDVLTRLAPLFDELDYVWAEPIDVAAIERGACAWLAEQLAIDDDDARRHALGVERAFVIDAPVWTMMGPRDAAWRDQVRADPMRAADAFAWWHTGRGQAARARALLAMWHDVAWREPLDGDERDVLSAVHDDLVAARRADPALELPWPEWAELLDLLGEDDDDVRSRAGDRAPTLGYRRYDLELELADGWTVQLPAAFVGRWDDDDRYWATDGDRAFEFTCLTADGETDSAHLIEIAAERHPVVERLADGARCGRAEAFDDGDVRVIYGLIAHAPHVAIVTCNGPRDSEPWSLGVWRSLRRA